MSSLQQSLAKTKLNGLPFSPPSHPELTPDFPAEQAEHAHPNESEDDLLTPLPESSINTESDSSSASSASSASSTGTIKPNERKGRFAKGQDGGYVCSEHRAVLVLL